MAYDTAMKWIRNVGGQNQAELILSLDNDDPKLVEYQNLFLGDGEWPFTTIIFNDNNNVVDAMNAGAKIAQGDLLVCISDDFECFQNWDEELIKLIDSDVQAIQVKDGIINEKHSAYYKKYRMHEYIMTLPIMTMGLYKLLGYIYYPEYTGMFADNDLAEMCQAMGVLKQSKLLFNHNHFTVTKKEDETYKRHNNQPSWDIGQKLINERRLNNFNAIINTSSNGDRPGADI